jgi:hypothetical protein
VGEYPGAVGQVGPIPTFLGEFPARVPALPDFAAQHPPFATVFYVLVDRVWAGLDAAALATVAAALAARLVAVVRERAWGSFEAATAAAILTAACWGHTRGEVERMWQFLVPFAVVVAARQLLRWRASLPLVAGLLLAQALAIQVLFYTRW